MADRLEHAARHPEQLAGSRHDGTGAAPGKRQLSHLLLDDQPVFDGLIAAGGKLYMTTMNGKIICLNHHKG